MDNCVEYTIVHYCCPFQNCSKHYNTKFNLKRHVEYRHLKQYSYFCQICNKPFVSKQILKEHNYIHQNTMPYKCLFCDKKFRQLSQLGLHKRIHEENYESSLKFAMSESEYLNKV